MNITVFGDNKGPISQRPGCVVYISLCCMFIYLRNMLCSTEVREYSKIIKPAYLRYIIIEESYITIALAGTR